MDNLSANALADSLLDWWRLAGVEPDIRPIPRAATPSPESFQQAIKPRPAQSRPSVEDSWDDAQPAPARPAGPLAKPKIDAAAAGSAAEAVAEAQKVAAACTTLAELKKAIADFAGVSLRATAKQSVFADGVAGAAVMVVGEAPGRDEDEQGKPFVGAAGQLLDKMLASIGLTRAENVYISNILNWRPPGNRQPTQTEILISMPFIERHIALAAPKILILAGGVSAKALLRTEDGIMRLRGRKTRYVSTDGAFELPAFPIFHPSYLLRRPQEKRLAWADLLAIEKAIAAL
ncbi:MAG: uracil-DNA glycosylase [Caulobacterales bacterium]